MVMMSVAEQHSTVRGSLAGAAAVCTEHTTSTTIVKHTSWQHYCQAHYYCTVHTTILIAQCNTLLAWKGLLLRNTEHTTLSTS